MSDSIFNENMTSTQARLALYAAAEGKTEAELEKLKAEYERVSSVIFEREMKLAREGWFID